MIISAICRKNIEVKFTVSASLGDSNAHESITEMEEQVKMKNWEKERLVEDVKRQEELLKQVKDSFGNLKQQLMDRINPSLQQLMDRISPLPLAKVHSQYLFILLETRLLHKAIIQFNVGVCTNFGFRSACWLSFCEIWYV